MLCVMLAMLVWRVFRDGVRVVQGLLLTLCGGLIGIGVIGTMLPDWTASAVKLEPPLRQGSFYVAQGGSHGFVNAIGFSFAGACSPAEA